MASTRNKYQRYACEFVCVREGPACVCVCENVTLSGRVIKVNLCNISAPLCK